MGNRLIRFFGATNGWYCIFITLLLIGVTSLTLAPTANSAPASTADKQAVLAVIKKQLAVFSSAGVKDKFELRKSELRKLYADTKPISGESIDLLYFGPDTLPIATTVDDHIDNVNTSFEFYQAHQAEFKIEVRDIRMAVVDRMAVVSAKMSLNVTYPDQTSEKNPGRWTVVLSKLDGEKWLICHEHMSFYAVEDADGAKLRVINELIEKAKSGE